MVGHVLVSACLYDGISCNMFCFTGRHFLLDVMLYLMVCIIGGLVIQFSGFTGIHVLQEDIFNCMIRLAGGHLSYEDKFYWRVCIRGSCALHEGMSCRSVQKLQSFKLLRV